MIDETIANNEVLIDSYMKSYAEIEIDMEEEYYLILYTRHN